MADLRTESPKTTEDFNSLCPEAPLPWERGQGRKRWSIVDANGLEVCGFDGSSPDAPKLIAMIVIAVNTCGGYRATRGDG